MPTTNIASGGLNKIFILDAFSAWRNAISALHQATLDSKPKLSNIGHVRKLEGKMEDPRCAWVTVLPKDLVELGFSRGLAQQDTSDGWRHFMASFFPVDALDKGFGADKLSAVHKAPPAKSYSRGPKHKSK